MGRSRSGYCRSPHLNDYVGHLVGYKVANDGHGPVDLVRFYRSGNGQDGTISDA
jgi:hypothetical protein